MLYPQIFTHRGLEPAKANFYSESTIEAFKDQLKRGFGLEVDLCFAKDGIVLCHDANLRRMTQGQDMRILKELSTQEACAVALPHGRLGTFEELMGEALKYPNQMLAVHFKGSYQTSENVQCFCNHLLPYINHLHQILVFDVIPAVASELRRLFPTLPIAASVAHPYDIERYQTAAKGTLLSLEELLEQQGLYTWAWLDEWDLVLANPDGTLDVQGKQLYTHAIFNALRSHHFKIALVTPELHATSPGLLGGEAHADAKNPQRLFTRIAQILALEPDALCTDFPEEVRALAQQAMHSGCKGAGEAL